MSGINITNEKDLLSFLKVLAEEASIKSLREYDKSYDEKYKADTKRYGSLSEQEEDDQDMASGNQEDVKSEVPTDDPEIEDVPVASYQSVKNAINDIRAGKSLKTDDVDQNLSAYYERLTEEERLVLQTYLSAVSKIIGLTKKGDEAQDPGDPPVSITMTSADEEADQEAQDDLPAEEPPTGEEDETEDTTPPIQVSEHKNISADNIFRNKIRSLMEK